MSTSVRNIDDLKSAAVLAEFNKLRLDCLKLKVGTIFHADASTAASAPTATDDATAIVRLNAVRAAYIAHIASACSATTGIGAHIAADATNTISAPVATDEGTAITLANEIKADYNAHRVLTASHPTADATNVIASADASNEGTLVTLTNELYTDINLHMAAAMQSQALLVTPA